MRHYTIVKHTPKTIVLKSVYRCRIFTGENGVEGAKVSYGTYIYASNLCPVEAENRQAEFDSWWAQEDKRVAERGAELKTYEEKLTANVMPADDYDGEDELIDPPDKADIHDSLARAMKISLLKVQDFCREKNLKTAQNELSLYNICSNAMNALPWARGGLNDRTL